MRLKMSTLLAIIILAVGCSLIDPDSSSWPPPDKPDGPSVCKIGEKVTFETEGNDPLDVHEFQWDFGDGTITEWDDGDEQIKHRFTKKGQFSVRVRERCPLKLFTSGWSDGRKVTVERIPTVKVSLIVELPVNPWQIRKGEVVVIGNSAGDVIYSTEFDGDLNLATIRPDYIIEVLDNVEENIVEWKGNNHGPQ